MPTPLKLTLSALVAFLILAFLYFFFDVHIMVHRLFSSNIREEVVRPHRGRILASDGTPLAETVRRYNIYMDCDGGGVVGVDNVFANSLIISTIRKVLWPESTRGLFVIASL